MRSLFIFLCFIISVSALDAKALDYLTSKFDVDRANRMYKKGDYESAISLYEQALSKNTNSYRIYNNLALAKYANGDKEEALELFNSAKNSISTNDKKIDRANLYYNSGVLNAANKKYREAIDDLIYSLTLNSKDDRAREAIEYARKKLKEEEDNKNNSSKNNNQENKNSKDENEGRDNNSGHNENNNKENEKNNENGEKNSNNEQDNNRDEKTTLRDLEIEQLLNSLRNLRKDDNYKQERLGNGYDSEKDW